MPVNTAVRLHASRRDCKVLKRMARSPSLPHRMVVQASALVLAAYGIANESIARECGTDADTVRRWRRKFEEVGSDAVGSIAPGRGRKQSVPQKTVNAIVHDTLHTVPDDESTSWTTQAMGESHGVGEDTVARTWEALMLRPWLFDTFKLSNDPDFEAKLVDVVGLYPTPSERAVVISFDERTQRLF